MAISIFSQSAVHDGPRNLSQGVPTSTSVSHTAGGANSILVVELGFFLPAADINPPFGITSVTYGGVSLTRLERAREVNGNFANTTDLWYLLNPTAGTANVVVSYTTNVNPRTGYEMNICAQTWNGVDLAATIAHSQNHVTGNFNAITLTDPSSPSGPSTNDVVIGSMCYFNDIATPPASPVIELTTATGGGSGDTFRPRYYVYAGSGNQIVWNKTSGNWNGANAAGLILRKLGDNATDVLFRMT